MAKRRSAGDGLVRKRSDGRWEGRIVVGHKADGSPIFRSVFAKTQGELLKKLHSRMEEYRDVELTEESGMTLGQWLDKWLADYMTLTVRESTLNSYKSITEHHIKPLLGDEKISSIRDFGTHQRVLHAGYLHPHDHGYAPQSGGGCGWIPGRDYMR